MSEVAWFSVLVLIAIVAFVVNPKFHTAVLAAIAHVLGHLSAAVTGHAAPPAAGPPAATGATPPPQAGTAGDPTKA
jgi:hypothetical protein